MKSLLLTLTVIIMSIFSSYSQRLGVSLSFSTGKVLSGDMFYGRGNNRFHLGYGGQFNGQKNTVVKERLANYGLTKIEDGNFLWMIDFGYSRIIAEKITIQPEISLGGKKFFTSYEDNRFTDGGYSLINYSKAKAGIGVNLGYIINDIFDIFIGYNTLKKINFGIRLSSPFGR